ncbi:hypothetical protein MRB53_001934 [Persea americana]|uniref:Uncharacterized protein n=1 Tax=Persea americana TaxID=3435 RepID=A0ACC2MT46_PERAE|nr:hypothetical protein MRB53_001934 [Persea americana]
MNLEEEGGAPEDVGLEEKCGILGSVLAQEGRFSKVSDFLSGAFKIVLKHSNQDDTPTTRKPKNDSVLDQIDRIRQEMQHLASSRSVTIITGRRSGATNLGMPVVVIVVVGYGYIWWKGWKLSDMMFATRRSLSEASTAIAKQLEQVYSSIADAKKQLTSRINHVDSSLDECKELSAATKDEVVQLHGDLQGFAVDVESVHRVVQTLETKIGRIEEKQDLTNQGVYRLCGFVKRLEESRNAEFIQASPSSTQRPALELPQDIPAPISRTGSLPPSVLALEPSSPSSSSSQTPKVLRPFHSAGLAMGLKELQAISDIVNPDAKVSNGTHDAVEHSSSSSSSSSIRFGWALPVRNPFARTRSAN